LNHDLIGLYIMRSKNATYLQHKYDRSMWYTAWLTFVFWFEIERQ